MTRLLVSVRDASEASLALAGGAHLIDVKEPGRGALGAAAPEVVGQVLAAVAGRAPVSIALGELADKEDLHSVVPGVAAAKLGLAHMAANPDWPDRWAAAVAGLPPDVLRVAVVYADWRAAGAPRPCDVLAAASPAGCRAMLVDTFGKREGDLFAHLPETELAVLVAEARRRGWLSVLGGSLTSATLRRAAALVPDFVAVRGAACRGGRQGPIDAERVHELAGLLGGTSHGASAAAAPGGVFGTLRAFAT
jgi:uncharacterized protein (UPF0264 family)